MKISNALGYAAVSTLLTMNLTGCGGEAFTKEELAQTRTAVTQAEQSGVEQAGAIALATAKDKLARAERLLDDGEEEEAEQLANEARVDAEFAVAVSQAQSAQRAAQAIATGIETLRREAARSQGVNRSNGPSARSQSAPSGGR